jgi:hypothetical protein
LKRCHIILFLSYALFDFSEFVASSRSLLPFPLHFSAFNQESEWLRETLHKWLDDEYCPEPANVDISNTAARSYKESLTAKQSDVGEILMKMVGDLQMLSYQESFHGAFSAANAAVRLITQRMESSSGE